MLVYGATDDHMLHGISYFITGFYTSKDIL